MLRLKDRNNVNAIEMTTNESQMNVFVIHECMWAIIIFLLKILNATSNKRNLMEKLYRFFCVFSFHFTFFPSASIGSASFRFFVHVIREMFILVKEKTASIINLIHFILCPTKLSMKLSEKYRNNAFFSVSADVNFICLIFSVDWNFNLKRNICRMNSYEVKARVFMKAEINSSRRQINSFKSLSNHFSINQIHTRMENAFLFN